MSLPNRTYNLELGVAGYKITRNTPRPIPERSYPDWKKEEFFFSTLADVLAWLGLELGSSRDNVDPREDPDLVLLEPAPRKRKAK